MKVHLTVAVLAGLLMVGFTGGCATPARHIADMHLGMTVDEVRKTMGRPFAIRAAKKYDNGDTVEVWEYITTRVSLFPKNYWVYFSNGKVVQWGEPGDFSGTTTLQGIVPVTEFMESKHKNQ